MNLFIIDVSFQKLNGFIPDLALFKTICLGVEDSPMEKINKNVSLLKEITSNLRYAQTSNDIIAGNGSISGI